LAGKGQPLGFRSAFKGLELTTSLRAYSPSRLTPLKKNTPRAVDKTWSEQSQAWAAACTEAENSFIGDNYRLVFLRIYGIVRNRADAQDLTQETLIKALQRWEQLQDIQRASQWLARVAANTAIDFLRRNKKRSFSEIRDPVVCSSENAEQMLLRAERLSVLAAGLDTLTDRERTALILRDVEKLPPGEVAIQMNCALATVRSHISKARLKFKRYLTGG